jgi:putative MATE family efflux protein
VSLLPDQEDLDLTEGGILKPLLFLSLPIVLTNLMQTAYNLADTFWLGQYSTEALAAISFGFPMVFLLISLGMGLSVAGSVLVAQHTGADESRKAEYAAGQTVVFALLGSALLGALGYPVVRPFLDFLGASPDVLPGATAYMEVIALGLPFMFGFFVFISLMRGAGDTVTPMLVMFGTVVLNILLDPFLIFGFEANPLFGMLGLGGLQPDLLAATGFTGMGIEGAAVATVFSRSLAMLVGLGIMFSGRKGIRIRLADLRPDFDYLRTILRIGVPASIEGTGRAVSVNALLLIVGLFATPVVAAFGIGTRVFSVIFLPAIAVARGVETMTGQNIGAGEYERAKQANYLAAKGLFLVLGAAGVAIFAFPRPIVAVFTDDPAVLTEGATFLRYVSLSFGFMGIMRAFSGGFRGAGKTMVAAAIAVGTLGGVRLPVAYVLSQFRVSLPYLPESLLFGVQGVWASFFVSNVVGAVVAWLWFRRGTWRAGDARGTAPGAGAAADGDVDATEPLPDD